MRTKLIALFPAVLAGVAVLHGFGCGPAQTTADAGHKDAGHPAATDAGSQPVDQDAGNVIPPDTDAGTNPPADGGHTYPPGSVTVVSSGNALPPAWQVSDPAVLKNDDSGTGAKDHLNQLVELAVSSTISTTPCPLPYTNPTTGKTYCDGFNAQVSGSSVVVDTFSFLGTKNTCVPKSGSVATVTGIWQDEYQSSTKTDLFVLALTDCSGVGAGPAYSGTATATASTDIANLLGNFAKGTTVTVSGVVIGRWTTTSGPFGFVIQDPAGGPDSGIKVSKGKSSTSTAAAPQIGDYVTVSGTAVAAGPVDHEIKL